MARTIAVEYIVKDEKGKELARFQDIEEAKRYDRMLDASDEIFDLLGGISELKKLDDAAKDEISFQLAKHADEIINILSSINGMKKASKKEVSKKSDEKASEPSLITELKEAV